MTVIASAGLFRPSPHFGHHQPDTTTQTHIGAPLCAFIHPEWDGLDHRCTYGVSQRRRWASQDTVEHLGAFGASVLPVGLKETPT
jgi:hypothetical protein